MVKFKDFSRPLSVFQVLFKANSIFKAVLCIQVLSSLCETCTLCGISSLFAEKNLHVLKTPYSLEILTCEPLICTVRHPKLILSNQMEEFISIKWVAITHPKSSRNTPAEGIVGLGRASSCKAIFF